MLKGVARRLWHSPTFTTWGSLGIRLASALLVLPLVLVRFPTAEVVVWQLFTSMFTLMLLLDAGLSATFSRMIAFAAGGARLADMRDMRTAPAADRAPDAALVIDIVSVLRWLTPRMALTTVALFAVLGWFALQQPIGRVDAPARAWTAWALILLSSGISFWGIAYTASLQGLSAIAPLRRVEVGTGLVQLASNVLTLLLGGGLLELVVVSQFWTVIGVLRIRALLRRLRPQLFASAPVLDVAIMRTVWPPSWRAGLGHLMGGGIVQASGVIYSQFGSTEDVGAYLVALRAVTVISGFSQAPLYSKLPLLARMQAGNQRQAQRTLAQRGMRNAHWVFVAGALLVAWFVDPLLGAIGSQTRFVSGGVWATLALAFFLERYGAMHLQLYSLTNRIVWHIANGCTGVVMVGLVVAGHRWLGIYTFPLAMLLSYGAVYCVYTVRLSYAAFELSFVDFESRTFLPALAALCAGLATSLVHMP